MPLDPSRLLRARERVRDYLDQLEVPPVAVDETILAVEEACTNAVRHSGSDEAMEISLGFDGSDLIARVKDCGKGFDIDRFDPAAVPDLLATGGRGLFLISRLMDDMGLRVDGGLEVRMVKRDVLSPAAPPSAVESRLEAPDASDPTSYRSIRQRALLDEMGEAFAAMDWGYRCVYANSAALRIAGFAEQDVLGREVWKLFPRASAALAGIAMREAMELGRSSIVEYHSDVFDGWVEQRTYPTSSGISIYLRHIDERKRRELERDEYYAALRSSEERYRSLAENIPSVLMRYDRRLRVVYLSPNAQAITGLPSAEFIGKTNREVGMPQELCDLWEPAIGGVFASGTGTELEFSIDTPGSGRRAFSLKLTPELGPEGRVDHVLGISTDITERKRVEAATVMQNRMLAGIRTILEAALTALDERALGGVCLQVAEEVTGSRFGFVGELGDDGTLHEAAISGPGWDAGVKETREGHGRSEAPGFAIQSLYGAVLRDGVSLIANDPAGHAAGAPPPKGHPALTAFLGVPLKLADKTIGIVAVANRERGYGDEQREALEGLAPVIVQAFERRRADAAIRESQERYRGLVESADEGFALHEMIFDDEGRPLDYRYLEANRAFGRLTGLDPAQVMGRTVKELIPSIEPSWIERFGRVVTSGLGEHFEGEAASLGGWYSGYAYPLGERLFGVTFTDITMRKQAELEREEAGADLQRTVHRAMGRTSRPGPPRLAWLAVPAFAIAIAAATVWGGTAVYAPMLLLEALTIGFLAVIPFVVAGLAARSYGSDPSAPMLLLGCGTLALGAGTLLANLHAGGPGINPLPAVYDSGALLAATCFFAAAIGIVAPSERRVTRPWVRVLVAYVVVVAIVVAQTMLVRAGVWPVHFIAGSGQTPFGRVILYGAAALFAVAAALLAITRGRRLSSFAGWYALALALVAVGLVSVSLQLNLGDPLNWLGRSAQYLAAIVMLVAVVASFRESGTLVLRNERALRESEIRYRRLVEMSPEAIVVHGGAVLYANPAAVALFGAPSADALLGKDPITLFDEDDRSLIAERVEGAYAGNQTSFGEASALRLDGLTVAVEGIQTRVEFAGVPAVQTVLHDVSERKRAEAAAQEERRRTDLLARSASLLLSSDDPEAVVRELCLQVMEDLDCQVFFNYLVESPRRMRLNAWAGIDDDEAARIEWLDYGSAVCGCAARDGVRIIAEDIPGTHDPRTDLVASYGVTAYACHPLKSRERVLGTLSFGTRRRTHFSPEEVALMSAVADHVAIAIDRKQVFEAEVKALARARAELKTSELLLGAANALADRSDLDEMLRTLSDALMGATPHSRVTISLWEAPRRAFRVVASQGRHPVAAGVVEWDRLSAPAREVVETLQTAVADYDLLDAAGKGVTTETAARLVLMVPVVRGDVLLGVLAIDEPGGRLEFSPREIAVVEGIAAQAGVAIENAQLYQAQSSIAVTLQEHLIHPLPAIAGLDAGRVGTPAFAPELVGGDFSHVFSLNGRLVGALIGDVAGKGVKAAGLTETIHTAISSFARIDTSPAFMLRKTNELLLEQATDMQFATAFLLVLDLQTGEARYASAGHPTPVLRSGATCTCLDVEFGLPLGSFPCDYQVSKTILAPGDSVVMFTDGVTEARVNGELFGERRACEAVCAAPDDAQAIAGRLRDAAVDFAGRLKDDLQILVIRRT